MNRSKKIIGIKRKGGTEIILKYQVYIFIIFNFLIVT
jgi:hypothetical protein